ncbi:MAG: MgtC/SapB family protein [Streptococcaceae bacterium]|jgi:putative Mg2+ transporter-C (MgtC) family protein|nr:MgtC/SapB family protein [Streptococcaceae bacterium]
MTHLLVEFPTQLEWLLRLVVAGICGFAIGYERNNRLKVAGVRTHLIVALASALIMLVSKYGFNDLLSVSGIGLDPSRIAAQIVSGIGFLGAGMIFVHNQSVNGLTTAAGIWATAGIGMAIGSGLYFIGIAAAVLILIFQTLLHKNLKWLQVPVADKITMVVRREDDILPAVQQTLSEQHIEILGIKVSRKGQDNYAIELRIKAPENYKLSNLWTLFSKDERIESIEY